MGELCLLLSIQLFLILFALQLGEIATERSKLISFSLISSIPPSHLIALSSYRDTVYMLRFNLRYRTFYMGSEKNSFPAPEDVLRLSIEQLRTAGLSGRKAEYGESLSLLLVARTFPQGACIPLVSLFAPVRFERETISNPLVTLMTDFMNTLFP